MNREMRIAKGIRRLVDGALLALVLGEEFLESEEVVLRLVSRDGPDAFLGKSESKWVGLRGVNVRRVELLGRALL